MQHLFLLLLLVCTIDARADESALLYTRDNITIIRHSVPPLPWQPSPAANDTGLVFDTEIRDGAAFYTQKGWFNLSGPSSSSAVMLTFGAPVLAPIIASSQYDFLDVLTIDKEGKITQIFPHLRMSGLEEDLYPSQPISAFLFLKSGTVAKLFIAPGDIVEYKLFRKPPTVLSAPQPPAEPATPATPASPKSP